jgi:23S rRNA (uracil1939-C5)-methyltransferase
MRIPKTIENLRIDEAASEGKFISKPEGGKVIFTEFTAPGDVVDVELRKTKASFAEAKVLKFHSYSDHRQEPVCQHYGTCGGCRLQHIQYSHQLSYKAKQVKDALERIGKIPLPEINPIAGSEETEYYRNKMEYSFSSRRWLEQRDIQKKDELSRNALGFHVPGMFDRIVNIEHCYLQDDIGNQIRNSVYKFAEQQNLVFFDQKPQKGCLRSLMIRNTVMGELMVLMQFGQATEQEIELVMNFLKTTFPQITSLLYVVNQKLNDTIYDQEVIVYHGAPHIVEDLDGLKFRIQPKSFFQTNTKQALKLYQIARAMAGLKGNEIVYDLYTGTGTIANFVARQAKKVVGVESVAMAIEDAKLNSSINGITNTEFFVADMKDLFKADFIAQHGKPDVIITDPPRAGMHEHVVRTMLDSGAPRIVYISCNPATQARDLAWLDEKYVVKEVQPVDMFPHTHHCENVVLLELR